jgi:hypothetical protein
MQRTARIADHPRMLLILLLAAAGTLVPPLALWIADTAE